MPQLSEVRQALKRIGDGAFQELGDLLFYYIYRLNDIESRGSVIKKCKTKKGSPDTILTDSKGRLIFIEYTTQERGSGNAFYRKLEDDIKSCFNLRKTKIQPSSIYKIILCHTERLASDEKEKLVALCKSYNDKCLLESRGVDFLACELQKHPALLKNLGIKVGTGQIQESIDFIEEYENPSLKLATPLSNIFLGREKELEDGLAHLSNNDILVVTGAPGVGKTKISLELCRRYCQTHKKTHFLCVTDKGESIIDDFYLKVVPNRDYILFVDDANRTGHFKSILSLIRDKSKNIKVVATVRDYAKSKIGEQTLEYEKVQSLNIQNLSNDEITKILESDSFKIRNSRFKKRILDIANGNIRIALMCARIALEKKNLMVLSNAEQMYDAYFDEPYKYILNNDGLGREALKILGILSFFKVIKKDNVEIISKILFIFNIEESIFWSICSKLDNDEIVDLYENEAVKMSDQVFSTYLFYKVFFKERLLDLSLLIENFFDYRNSLIDSINPVLSCFDAEKDQETIKKIVVGIWREKFATKCDEEKITYLEMFSTFLRMETFAYLKMHIAKIPDSPEGTVYNFAYKDKDFIYKRVNNNILSLINAFRYEKKEEMTYALDLLFMYLEKKPELITEVIYMFKEYWSYDLNDHEIAYERQMCLFDYLIKKSKYSKICKGVNDAIIQHFMQFFFHIDEYKKRNFIFYSYPLQPSDDLFLLRKCIWDYINLE
ncbi:MAG: ATP-binding protein, partial [Bacteroidetes bacterium]|nr:ATP-binding protein [Bacteroidota bacterium]